VWFSCHGLQRWTHVAVEGAGGINLPSDTWIAVHVFKSHLQARRTSGNHCILMVRALLAGIPKIVPTSGSKDNSFCKGKTK